MFIPITKLGSFGSQSYVCKSFENGRKHPNIGPKNCLKCPLKQYPKNNFINHTIDRPKNPKNFFLNVKDVALNCQ